MHKMIYYPKGGMQMYMNTGYLNQSRQDFKDKRQPLVVGSCGCYRLSTDIVNISWHIFLKDFEPYAASFRET